MKRLLIHLLTVSSLASMPFAFAHASSTASLAATVASAETPVNFSQLTLNLTHNTNLSQKAIEMAFAGYNWAVAHAQVKDKDILTIVDFTVPSNKDRLYVVNLKTGDILMKMPVAHGKNSAQPNSPLTTHFSNADKSLQSSIGVFLTDNPYYGHHGFSLRIRGLESSNNNVYAREVVVHGADYVTPAFIQQHGRAGTSWGCFAVDPHNVPQLVNYIKSGSVMYAYGQSTDYLASTKILTAHA